MTREQIASVADTGILRPRGRQWELHALHVPFDTLADSERYEQQTIRRLTQGTCAAVLGASGTGKTSAIAWICHHLPGDHIALPVPVTGVANPGDVGEFAQLALSTVLEQISLTAPEDRDLRHARADSTSQTHTPASARGTLGGGPIPAEVSMNTGSLQQEFREQRLPGDYLLALNSRLVPIFRDAGLTPVFVFEDTEAIVGGDDPTTQAEAFFAGPLTAFVQQIDTPTLVAAPLSLITSSPAFTRLAPMLERLEIPLLADRAKTVVTAILTRRLTHADAGGDTSDIFEPDALAVLADFYRDTSGDLRRVLAAAQDATEHAVDYDTGERVSAADMRLGVAQWQLD